jgi:hypothetical protein
VDVLDQIRSAYTARADVPPFPVLLVNFLIALTLMAVGAKRFLAGGTGRGASAFAFLPLMDAVLLLAFVFGEDAYRDNGISRWNAYRSPGSALGPFFVLTVVLLAVSCALLVYSGLRGRGRLFASTAVVSGTLALFFVTGTIIGFSAN